MLLILALLSVAGTQPASLVFHGLSGSSTEAAVRKQFPTATTANICRRQTDRLATFADGPMRCQYLKARSYRVGGYDFELMFTFYESGALKSAVLTWPGVDGEPISEIEVSNAYFLLAQQLGTKYGKSVNGAPCSLIGELCAEWQMDGSADWSAGGERIELQGKKEKYLRGVKVKYNFADRLSLDRL